MKRVIEIQHEIRTVDKLLLLLVKAALLIYQKVIIIYLIINYIFRKYCVGHILFHKHSIIHFPTIGYYNGYNFGVKEELCEDIK